MASLYTLRHDDSSRGFGERVCVVSDDPAFPGAYERRRGEWRAYSWDGGTATRGDGEPCTPPADVRRAWRRYRRQEMRDMERAGF